MALLLFPSLLNAQGFLEQFSYEGLGFSGIGIEVGAVASDRLTPEFSGALRIDYGRIAPRVRVLIGVSYFKGQFEDEEIASFEAALRGVVFDPTSDFRIDVGTISWSDIETSLDFQYMLESGHRVTSYFGLGFAVHLRNGSGTAIEDTFVEDALDTIEAGLAASLGTSIALIPQVHFTLDIRGGLTSELRTATARAGFMYRVRGT